MAVLVWLYWRVPGHIVDTFPMKLIDVKASPACLYCQVRVSDGGESTDNDTMYSGQVPHSHIHFAAYTLL